MCLQLGLFHCCSRLVGADEGEGEGMGECKAVLSLWQGTGQGWELGEVLYSLENSLENGHSMKAKQSFH